MAGRVLARGVQVSIHAPRVRGDAETAHRLHQARVSIHAPRVRGDARFLRDLHHRHVSIHAPRVRGDSSRRLATRTNGFNSRPSCEGRHDYFTSALPWPRFNSRPSCEGRLGKNPTGFSVIVSIHAPRVRGDRSGEYLTLRLEFQFTPLV